MSRGHREAPRDLTSRVIREDTPKMAVLSFTPTMHAVLTEAERVTALGICRGLSNAQIAEERGVVVRTVANQVASIFKKLGVWSRAEVAARVGIAELL